eukprot:scaffold198944_cov19-Tisochrysis_lutea.AAC.1
MATPMYHTTKYVIAHHVDCHASNLDADPEQQYPRALTNTLNPQLRGCSEMLVQWVTLNSSNPVVRWGEKPDHLKHTASARTFTYARSDMCGGAAAGVWAWACAWEFVSLTIDGKQTSGHTVEKELRPFYAFPSGKNDEAVKCFEILAV